MKSIHLFIVTIISFFPLLTRGQEEGLQLHYQFKESTWYDDIVVDASGNYYNGTLKGGAKIKAIGNFMVLDMGSTDGYLDMGEETGALIGSLKDFTISCFLNIGEEANLSANGNFVWSFSNSVDMASDRNGGLFFHAKNTRYAISEEHWPGEESVGAGEPFPKEEWVHIAYVQSGGAGILYLDGEVAASGDISIDPEDLGETPFNFLGRPSYASDAYLKHAMYYDFRIYDIPLSRNKVVELSGNADGLREAAIIAVLEDAADKLQVEGLDQVKTNLELHGTVGDISIS